MKYTELEADILQLVVDADETGIRAFADETVTRLVRPELRSTAADDLTEEAATALTTACENVLTLSAAELADRLQTVYDGLPDDDDLEAGLLVVIRALAHWVTYRQQSRRGEIYELAIRSIEEVDFEVGADLDDFLGTAEMAAEYERIRGLLRRGSGQGNQVGSS